MRLFSTADTHVGATGAALGSVFLVKVTLIFVVRVVSLLLLVMVYLWLCILAVPRVRYFRNL